MGSLSGTGRSQFLPVYISASELW